MQREKPQQDVCAAPSIHRQILVLDVISDDVANFRLHLKKFPDLVQQLKSRFSEAQLSVVFAVGHRYWGILCDSEIPAPTLEVPEHSEYPFPSSHADLAIVVKSDRPDACYFAAQVLLQWLAAYTQMQRELQSFRYLDGRNLFGFIDIPEKDSAVSRYQKALGYSPQNPEQTLQEAHVGYTYMWIAQMMPDLKRWELLSSEVQREVMGIDKLNGAPWPTSSQSHHEVLSQHSDLILRDPMPMFSMRTSAEVWVDYSADAQSFQARLNALTSSTSQAEADPLMDYLSCTFSSVFVVPSLDWFSAV
ncbi:MULTISPECIES: Dyp-type peroxidase domain-containing protein [Gammaproteobacteria]|uniref:Dyp-type peroxidase n=1 Tax=Gammaproteobacteria TaxID=1236 RepID=UPI000DD09C5F|nr:MULTISPECIES: Dyp-type peroxidase domain-containing protein [Gammaproteobacteria]RTE86260.1 hypothetical protein DQX04_06735 [Aliidiomarina sp. B3213]TCZ91611.1 hypothetical protein EYQ95_06745 [Lysobacter sp. N42]